MLKSKYYQGFIAFGVSMTLLVLFYGAILKSPNYVLFSKSGDGLKSTFCSYYHLEYDSSYNYTMAQNYPFGESVYYTGGQPFIINTLKWLKKSFGFDFSEKLIAILNIWMLFSIVLGAVILYLLLRRLKLPVWYSIIVSNIIIFLSPQVHRFGGHYNLSYFYFLPLIFLLIHIFWTAPRYIVSIAIGLLTFIALGTHAYFFAFFFMLAFFFYFFAWRAEPEKFNIWKVILPHFFIQLVVPLILFTVISRGGASDRTAYPWGFFATRASFESVFLPIGKPYGGIFDFINVKWEGVAYVGAVSLIATFVLLFNYFRKITNKSTRSEYGVLTNNTYFNSLLLASIIALLFSFALPFQMMNLQWLLNYTGPLRQFRAVGRFSWLFFYAINIWTFYFIWQLFTEKKNTSHKVVVALALLIGGYDAWLNVKGVGKGLNNYNELLADSENNTPENKWVHEIQVNNYQAIMPLPYFHVGSETFWISGSELSERHAFICSMKTGLPLNAVMLSRTSLSQTMKSLSLYFEPLEELKILKNYTHKPLLLLVAKDKELNENEARYLKYSDFITENKNIRFYELQIDSIRKMQIDFIDELKRKAKSCSFKFRDGITTSDLTAELVYVSSKSEQADNTVTRTFNQPHLAKNEKVLIDTLLGMDSAGYKFSFWMSDLDKDLIPRTRMEFMKQNQNGDFSQVFFLEVFRKVVFVDRNGWGLVEFSFRPDFPEQEIRLKLINSLTTSETYSVDKLLIHPENMDVTIQDSTTVSLNNRLLGGL